MNELTFQKNTPPSLALSQSNADLLEEFLWQYRSPHTRTAYEKELRFFFELFQDKTLTQLGKKEVLFYRRRMEELEYAPKSVNRALSALSSFFKFLLEKDLVALNPFAQVRRPSQTPKDPTEDLTDAQVLDLLKVVDEHHSTQSGPLHRALFYVLFATGVRRSELLQLKIGDVDQTQEHWSLRVRAKGEKYLVKYLNPKAQLVLQEYLIWCQQRGLSVDARDWLFRPTKNPQGGNLERPLNPKTFYELFKHYCLKANLHHRLSPHSARATYIGSALDAGVDLFVISQDVGHQSVKTTQEYNKRRRSMQESPTWKLGYFDQTKSPSPKTDRSKE